MCDQDHFDDDRQEYEALGLVTRKQFGVMLGAGIAMMLPKVANAAAVTESDVNVKTPDGTADCYFVHPASGTAPGVLMWPDIFGLRPAFRQMAKRLAESGYSVLVVNPFYRVKKAPTAEQGAATPIQGLTPLMQALNETTHMTDAKAFIGWLDQQPSVAKNRKMGTQGYCMGGPIALRTAAAVPDRVGAVASFHGAALVANGPNSPHLEAAKTKAQFAIASSRRATTCGLERQNRIEKDTFAKAGLNAEVEVYAGSALAKLPAGFRRLQRGTGREGMEPFARVIRKSSGLNIEPGLVARTAVHACATSRVYFPGIGTRVQLIVRLPADVPTSGPGRRMSAGIVDGRFILQRVVIGARELLSEMQV